MTEGSVKVCSSYVISKTSLIRDNLQVENGQTENGNSHLEDWAFAK